MNRGIYTFNYGLLREKIKDEFGTHNDFAEEMGITRAQCSLLLNGKARWRDDMIVRACELLGIELSDAADYFFSIKVRKCE